MHEEKNTPIHPPTHPPTQVQVDLVSFGAPNVGGKLLSGWVGGLGGWMTTCLCLLIHPPTHSSTHTTDAQFTQLFNERVNNRHITFTGVGAVGEAYYIGGASPPPTHPPTHP